MYNDNTVKHAVKHLGRWDLSISQPGRPKDNFESKLVDTCAPSTWNGDLGIYSITHSSVE